MKGSFWCLFRIPLHSFPFVFLFLPVESSSLPPDQYLLDLPELQGRDRPTFANFIPGENTEVLAVLCSMAAGRGPKILYIYGPRGAGLTHLLEAFLPGSTESDFRVPLYQPDVKKYAVDDIETLDEGYSRELLQLQNAVYADPDARLVCAGRFPPKELPLPEGVKNRLLGGPCYFVAPLTEADRFRELSRQAALRGILLTPDMTQWMSRHLPRDMRSLTRIMDVANQIALHLKRRVTLQIIREAVKVSGVEEKDPEL